MYTAFGIMNIVIILLITGMIVWLIRLKPGKAQVILLMMMMCMLIFCIAVYLELTMSDQETAALLSLKIQYVAQMGFLFGIVRFVSLFTVIYVSGWAYCIQGVICGINLMAVMTVEHHHLFYKGYQIIREGAYNRIQIEPGILYIIHYIYFGIVILWIIGSCLYRLHKCSELERKRIHYIIVGITIFAVELFLKLIGLFGSYNPIAFALFILVACLFISLLKYGYFDSVKTATENALNHGEEALLVIGIRQEILFANPFMLRLVPDIKKGMDAYQIPILRDLFDQKIKEVILGESCFQANVAELEESGYIEGYMLWLVNVTDYHEYVGKVEQEREYAEQRSIEKSNFLARMSHEIRTPITAMLGMNEMILRESREHQILEYAKDVQESGEILLGLVNDILDFSRIESGKMELAEAPYETRKLMQKSITMLQERAKAKNLKLILDAEKELPSVLKGDKGRILQVILNLLSNAIKYTKEGKIILKIGQERKGQGEISLKVSVTDTGIGIPKEELHRIFESFTRAEELKNEGIQGTGLGLNISSQLLKLMGGKMEVESVYGEGSCFSFSIIQKIVSEEPVGTIDYERTIKTESCVEQETEEFTAEEGKILLVDDNEMNRKVFWHLFQNFKIQVDLIESGKQCIQKIKQKYYHIIFLDHMMPEMDGIETLHRMREMGEENLCAQTPVIVLTANAVLGVEEQYREEGFNDYLSKPVNSAQLGEILRRYLPKECIDEVDFEKKHGRENPETRIETKGWLEELKKKGINTEQALRYQDGDSLFYQELLSGFCAEMEERKERISGKIEKEDWRNLAIEFHDLKNQAKSLGADHFSGQVFFLEQICREEKDGKREEITEKFMELLPEWEKLILIFGSTGQLPNTFL